MSNQVYQIPVVFQDLRQPESFHQLFDALELLNRVSDDVFTRITQRVQKEKARLDALKGRIDQAMTKVKKITGTTKAITVFSPAKFPAPPTRPQFPSSFADVAPQEVKHTKYRLDIKQHPLLPPEPIKYSGGEVKIEIQSVESRVEEVKDGLGRLPEYLSSVSSLLLFNTSENLYKKYVSLDPLEGKEKEKQKQTDNKNALAAAPISVAEGDKMPILGERSLVFVPGPTQIPEWNLPPDLPDLKVAQLDLSQLKLPEFASIAPSDQIPKDLPVVSGTSTEPLKENVNQPSPATGPVTAASPSPPPPPPPPPPPSTTATTASETTTVASNATVTSEGSKQGDIPTPPPLPSASLAKMNLPPPQEGRERLLESIRQGKKLRPVGERKDVPPKAASKKMPKKAPTVEGIFSELFLALKRRREGIASGKVKVSSSESKKDGESATSADNTAKDTGNTENSQQSENEPKQIKTPLLNAFEKDDDASEKKDDGHNSDWDKEDKQ